MTKIHPLSTFCLQLFVAKWNESQRHDLKKLISAHLTSAHIHNIRIGMNKLFELVEYEMQKDEIDSPSSFIFWMSDIVHMDMKPASSGAQSSEDCIRRDLFLYFQSALVTHGPEKRLPLPDMFYDLNSI